VDTGFIQLKYIKMKGFIKLVVASGQWYLTQKLKIKKEAGCFQNQEPNEK
jgi:uncharacterized protein (DUF1919 family)